ncbi:MAG: glycine oxidase ThiO [Pseudomonadota bacterium]|nr:glycine oxidase ThiO [Pseudomonadota bacterium]
MTADVIIVGAGLIGLATAYELSMNGYKVLVIDRGQVGQESSWAGGGILSPLMPWAYSEAVNTLARYSCSIYPEWVDGLMAEGGVDPELICSGLLHLPPYDLDQALEWLHQYSVHSEIVNAKEVEAEIGSDEEALWLQEISQIRNPRLTQSLRTVLEKHGVKILEGVEVNGLIARNQAIATLETSHGEFAAAAYVVTGGAWSRSILGAYALNLSIRPVRGQMLLFKGSPGRLKRILYCNGTYIIPRQDGHILTGSTLEEVGFDKRTTCEARQELHARAAKILPWLEHAEFVQQWSGLRPGSPESVPVIDRHPYLNNLYVNTGHFRYGVTMAPGSAKLILSRLLDQEFAINVLPYSWPS